MLKKVKQKLKDCTLMKKFMTSRAFSKDKLDVSEI
jgi:hypothetical protein